MKLIIVGIGWLGFILTGCAQFLGQNHQKSRPADSPYTMPARAYLAMAQKQIGVEQQNLLLLAAGRLLDDGDARNANAILNQTHNLSAAQQDQKQILIATMNLDQHQAHATIIALSDIHHLERLPIYYQIQYHELLATAFAEIHNSMDAIHERIKLEYLLKYEASILQNQRNLWNLLIGLSIPELNAIVIETPSRIDLHGWAELALIAKIHSTDPQQFLHEIERWQQKFTQHPANKLLPQSLAAIEQILQTSPRKIALLLPLTGPLSGPGNAVRDGFVAAYTMNTANKHNMVQVYDTASTDVALLYQQAITDGAESVVGPLTKSESSIVAQMEHPVPTLLLNDVAVNTDDNLYSFGLSPINEARLIALRARKAGNQRALIIAPHNAWGEEITSSFINQWRAADGTITDQLVYDNQTNLPNAIRNLLRVSEKQARAKQYHSQITTQRRQDFDMIFLLAYPSEARQIMPLLRYYFAANVPVYAPSTVYSGNINTLRDKDLDGIIFCDIPWMFSHQLANKNWPESLNSYNRLYAIGLESYTLVTQFNQLLVFPAMDTHPSVGILYVNPRHQVAHIPAWGQFKGGVAQLI